MEKNNNKLAHIGKIMFAFKKVIEKFGESEEIDELSKVVGETILKYVVPDCEVESLDLFAKRLRGDKSVNVKFK